ncbi:hypothetical protein B0H15DRAFT_833036 [Mycena belliarum]|uniref:Uncharacterized protein n=1 Tax=Mycena belliarum TaxID=1033014 RepID=A0AAD6U6Q4_9AGAR|nr:hypothetical protein B0H15DRAFT_833036 [Mycena belliae]
MDHPLPSSVASVSIVAADLALPAILRRTSACLDPLPQDTALFIKHFHRNRRPNARREVDRKGDAAAHPTELIARREAARPQQSHQMCLEHGHTRRKRRGDRRRLQKQEARGRRPSGVPAAAELVVACRDLAHEVGAGGSKPCDGGLGLGGAVPEGEEGVFGDLRHWSEAAGSQERHRYIVETGWKWSKRSSER